MYWYVCVISSQYSSCFWVVFLWAWCPNILRVKGHESQLKSQAWPFYMSWHNTTAHMWRGSWSTVSQGMLRERKNMTKLQSYCHQMTDDLWKTCFPKFLAKINTWYPRLIWHQQWTSLIFHSHTPTKGGLSLRQRSNMLLPIVVP